MTVLKLAAVCILAFSAARAGAQPAPPGSADRMSWWRDARFGLFIHWGIYAIPAGKWGDKDTYGEWIRHQAKIPDTTYAALSGRWNPEKFDAKAWVRAAKAAGMRYIVITSKHHDGFCNFDSAATDFDVMSTPFHRDPIRELAEACRGEGIRLCLYYSIMDWHHPDYLPRRPWEDRPADGADFERYVAFMKTQLGELLRNYHPGVLWFDGQWEGTWTHERAVDLERYLRAIQPDLIINNRIDKGGSAHGMNRGTGFCGDFGTPEQEIPAMGFPGVDWESCMTMNEHWGYNAADKKYKSAEELIRTLVDVASKGGNFLLNVGPTAEGEFPPESVERLAVIGKWMDANGESIHGTQASPFPELKWGRCTQKRLDGSTTRLFLHVFEWPGGRLLVPGLYSRAKAAFLLADGTHRPLSVTQSGPRVMIEGPESAPDPIDTVVVLDVEGKPDVALAPEIKAPAPIFVGSTEVTVSTPRERVELRCTTDGSEPVASSSLASGPIRLAETTTLKARAFRSGAPVSPTATATFTKEMPAPASSVPANAPGLRYDYYEGDWEKLPDFDALKPAASGVAHDLSRSERLKLDHFAFRYRGYINIPVDAAYTFALASDDGSRLWIDGKLLIDNDGMHSMDEKTGFAALAAGPHPITVEFFEVSGGHELEVWWEGPGIPRQEVPPAAYRCQP